jgi:hypothetical protein
MRELRGFWYGREHGVGLEIARGHRLAGDRNLELSRT